MPKPAKGPKFYAVQRGRQPGVFLTWQECEKQIKGYSNAKYQSFKNAAEAQAFVAQVSPTEPSVSSSSTATASRRRPTEPSARSSSTSSRGRTSSNAQSDKGKKRIFQESLDESRFDVVYCDGACKGNGKPGSIAGVGVWWGENDPRNIAERCPGDQTNNRAELIAIARVLESTPKSKKPLLIKTDSQYSIKCFLEWMPKWLDNNFRSTSGDPVKNSGIIKYIAALMKTRGLMGQQVRLSYVKGHSGIEGNEGADAQANKGALLPPLPERDWLAERDLVLIQAEEEHRTVPKKPTPIPVTVVAWDLSQQIDTPRKLRKVNNEVPFSRLPSTSSTKPLSVRQLSTNAITPTSSPSGPIPIVEVSSSPPRDIKTESTSQTADLHHGDDHTKRGSQPMVQESYKSHEQLEKPIRRHGVGLFTETPPPNATLPRKFAPLPSSYPRPDEATLKKKEVTATLGKPLSMSVNAADINLSDYLDCVQDDDDFDEI